MTTSVADPSTELSLELGWCIRDQARKKRIETRRVALANGPKKHCKEAVRVPRGIDAHEPGVMRQTNPNVESSRLGPRPEERAVICSRRLCGRG